MIANQSVIDYYLNDLGFRKIKFDNASLIEKAADIHHSKILVGDYRSGIQLAFISQLGSNIIEYQSPNFFRKFNHFISSTLQLNVISIIGTLKSEDNPKQNAEYTIRPFNTLAAYDLLHVDE